MKVWFDLTIVYDSDCMRTLLAQKAEGEQTKAVPRTPDLRPHTQNLSASATTMLHRFLAPEDKSFGVPLPAGVLVRIWVASSPLFVAAAASELNGIGVRKGDIQVNCHPYIHPRIQQKLTVSNFHPGLTLGMAGQTCTSVTRPIWTFTPFNIDLR